MKLKNLLLTAVAVLSFGSVANAQLYLTGNIGLKNSTGKNETKVLGKTVTTDDDPKNSFNIGAEVGYYLSSNAAVGADISYGFSKTKNANDKNYWTSNNMFYFDPYFRYDFVSTDKVSFGLKARLLLGFGKTKNQDTYSYKNSAIGFGILPVLNYKFNSNWSAGMSFGNLYYNHFISKSKGGDSKDISNNWNLDLSLQSLTFSVVYTF